VLHWLPPKLGPTGAFGCCSPRSGQLVACGCYGSLRFVLFACSSSAADLSPWLLGLLSQSDPGSNGHSVVEPAYQVSSRVTVCLSCSKSICFECAQVSMPLTMSVARAKKMRPTDAANSVDAVRDVSPMRHCCSLAGLWPHG